MTSYWVKPKTADFVPIPLQRAIKVDIEGQQIGGIMFLKDDVNEPISQAELAELEKTVAESTDAKYIVVLPNGAQVVELEEIT